MKTSGGVGARVFCDQCGQRIARAADGHAVSAGQLEDAGDSVPCAYLHKGQCDDEWQARHPVDFDGGSDELVVHLEHLITSLRLAFPESLSEAWSRTKEGPEDAD